MGLLEWVAKEIKKRIPQYERLRPMTKGWQSKLIRHKEEGGHQCWFGATNLCSEKPYFVLTFGNRNSDKRVRINILPWEEKERTPYKLLIPIRRMMVEKRKNKESPFISNPLYVSDQLSDRDIEAKIALRLLQEGEADFSNLIKSWLVYTFPKVNGIDDPSLSELVEYLRTHLNFAEDWRAFRKYIKKIVDRFSSGKRKISKDAEVEEAENDRDETIDEPEELDELTRVIEDETEKTGQEYSQGSYPVYMIVEILGIPEGKLYRWVREGKMKKTERKGVMVLDITEVRQFWEWKQQRKRLNKILSDHLKLDQDSARKWIKRLEKKGLPPKQIIAKARTRIQSMENQRHNQRERLKK